MEKIKLRKKIKEFDESCLEGNIKEVLSNISRVIKELELLGYEDIEIEKEQSYDYAKMVAYGYILETDSELKQRIQKENDKLEKEKKKLERQAKQFIKLKNKFEHSKYCDNPDIETELENKSGKDFSGQPLFGSTILVVKCKNCGKNPLLC